jgi:hypothetical protein
VQVAGALILTTLLLVLVVAAAIASEDQPTGDHGGTSEAGFLSSSVNSPAELAPLVEGADHVGTEPLTDPQAAEELPHSNLSRSSAEELLQEVFGDGLEGPAAFYDELDVESFRSDHVAVIAPEHLGDAPGLVSSLLPLRAVDDSGELAPVDLDLEPDEGTLQPANPLVDVEIPTELSAGIELPEAGVVIDVGSGQIDRTASEVGESSAFFPNIRPDSDFVVSAIPTGVETYTQLRSANAPKTETFSLSIGGDGQLRATDAGGAEVVGANGGLRLSVSAPTALDAEGKQVPVSLEVDGSSIIVSAKPTADTVYPVLVDPVFQYYNFDSATSSSWPGAVDWSRAANPGFGTEWGWPKRGMNAYAFKGATSPGNQATFNYYVPRYWSDIQAGQPVPTSYIRDMKLWGLTFTMPDETAPYPAYAFMQMGLWSDTMQQFVAYGKRYGYEGQLTNLSYIYDMVNPNENTDVKHGGFAIATFDSWNQAWRLVNVQYGSVEVTDQDSPSFGELGSVSQWMNGQPGSAIPYKVTDPGLGIRQLQLKYPRAGGGSGLNTSSLGCTGIGESACPRTSTQATKPITYDPSVMAQGENWVTITAGDPVEHTTSGTSRIKVDHTAPAVSLVGNMTEQGTVGVNLPEYTLNYVASDGDDATAAALTPFGSKGTAPGQLERPQGAAVDAEGNVWVSDRVRNRIIGFDKSGKFLREIGVGGTADGQIKDPRGLAIAPNGNIWVAEVGNKRLQQFTPTGTFVSKITKTEFSEPWGIAIGPDGKIWVADSGSQKVFQFKADGTYIQNRDTTQIVPGGGVPYGIDTDAYGNAWIAMQSTNKVAEVDSNLTTVFSFGSQGSGPGQLNLPNDVAVSDSGNILVTDDLNSRVQVFKPDGSFLRQFGAAGSANSQFNQPRGIDVGLGNTAVIADASNSRVSRWEHADQAPQSGAAKLQIKVDGTTVVNKEPGCSAKNCAISSSWVLNADNYAVGPHKVDVIATDGVGLQSTKSLNVETHGDLQPPALSLTGSMTEQTSLGNTRPSYRLIVKATDPGAAEERKSGVVSTSISVDGKVVDSSAPGCATEACSISREWTLNSGSFAVGSHTVQVVAKDGAGRQTTKTLTINIARDTTAPTISYLAELYNAPSGWVEQNEYPIFAVVEDPKGYGVTSTQLKIDGAVVRSESASCPAGGCTQLFAMDKKVNMAPYGGGAHPAELIATDGAGNARIRKWTINVDPKGQVPPAEAEDTLEALDETSPVNTVGDPQGEAAYEGTAENLYLDHAGQWLVGVDTAAPTTLPMDEPGALTVQVPTIQQYAGCPPRPEEENEANRTGAEEEALAQSRSCVSPVISNPNDQLDPVTVTPTENIEGDLQTLTPNAAAAVASNISPHVDLISRPLYDGAMIFSSIRDSAGAESFSWQISLDSDQSLELVNSKSALVVWDSGPTAFSITAIPAHDAIGSTVPTHLSVSSDVLTLTVEHRSAEFVYPVVAGAGWEGGFQTSQVVMPPPEGESGEVSEGQFGDEGIYAYHEIVFGPPEALASSDFQPLAAQQNSEPKRKRHYNFHDCRFDVNGYNGEVPGDGLKREGIHKCHGETQGPNGGYYTLHWAVSIHGTYFYQPHHFVWLNARPVCKAWGPSPPANMHCKGGPQNLGTPSYPNIDVVGDYRFKPGTWGGFYALLNPTCYRLSGRLPNYWVDPEPGHPVLMTTYHVYREQVGKGDPCDFEHLDEKLQ